MKKIEYAKGNANTIDENKIPKNYPGVKVYQRLQEYREENGLTIVGLCEELGWKSQQLYAMRKPTRTVRRSTLARILESLELSVEEFFDDSLSNAKSVMKKYPTTVLNWLATDDARRQIMAAYACRQM